MPVVSVLMVCHRDTPFLRPAIASVWRQTLTDLELVLVDNGAGLSPEVLGEVGRDPRLRWVRMPRNLGIPAGHNAGVEATQGEIIALLDHDDLMLPTRLERQVGWLRTNGSLGMVSSLAESIDAEGRVTGREFALRDADAQYRYTPYAAPVVTPAYAGRREVFVAVPYRSELTVTADFDFLARVAEREKMEAVPEVLLQYRHHTTQTTVEQAARIALERGVVRLLTARRRAGVDEGDDWKQRWLAKETATLEPAAIWREFAEQFLAEGFWVQAAFHARRSVSARRTLPALISALGLFARAWWRADAERHRVARMFFLGPVRALRLKAE